MEKPPIATAEDRWHACILNAIEQQTEELRLLRQALQPEGIHMAESVHLKLHITEPKVDEIPLPPPPPLIALGENENPNRRKRGRPNGKDV